MSISVIIVEKKMSILGWGNINFEKFIAQLNHAGYNETITFEIFSENTNDLLDSREKIAPTATMT